MTGRIILLRHGQTTANTARKLDTRPPGAELTELGRHQAYEVGKELAEYCEVSEGSLGRIEAMVCSVALRAGQTAMIAADAIETLAKLPERSVGVEVRTGIHELSAGIYEMKYDYESHHDYGVAASGWMHGDQEITVPGGETLPEILGRYVPVIEELHAAHPNGDVIVVSHGGIIRVVTAMAANVDGDFALESYIPNCRFTVLRPNGKPFGQWELERWADYPHPKR